MVKSTALSIHAAKASQFDAVVELLVRAGLPTRDLTIASIDNFLVVADANELLGAVALERYADVGLLRSLVVRPDRRRSGIGVALVDAVENQARRQGLTCLALLTETAKDFFLQRGYAAAVRAEAPKAVQESSEFAYVCPASATYMVKALV